MRVGGIQRGTVKKIELPSRSNQKVIVVMKLDGRTRNIVKKDSVAAIRSEGLLGDKYVEVSFGSANAEALKDGDTIGSEAPLDISELVKKTDQILNTAKDTMQNVAEISSKINQGEGSLGALVNDKRIYQQADAATAQAKAAAQAFDENMEALKHNFLLRGFFKKRGYEDSSELTKHQIAKLPEQPPLKEFAYDAKQIFDKPDSAKLLAASRPVEGEPRLRLLAPVDMVLHSATHLFCNEDVGNSLRDLVDLDSLLRNFSKETDFWPTLTVRAVEMDLTRPLYYALRYTVRILDTPIPHDVVSAAAIGGPPSLMRGVMDALFLRTLHPLHAGKTDGLAPLARGSLYVRAHWLRMPPFLLAYHLITKAVRREQPAAQ